MEIKAKAKRWGRSLGVIIPKQAVDANQIKENDDVVLDIRKPVLGKRIWGMLKDWKADPQRLKDEMREGWESPSDEK